MKTKLLKQLRAESWRKYEVRKTPFPCNLPWCIYTGPYTSIAYMEYATKQDAMRAARLLWHNVAERYLWEHTNKRKRNKYHYNNSNNYD